MRKGPNMVVEGVGWIVFEIGKRTDDVQLFADFGDCTLWIGRQAFRGGAEYSEPGRMVVGFGGKQWWVRSGHHSTTGKIDKRPAPTTTTTS